MAKLETKNYRLLEPGRYVLEILSAELVEDYGPQIQLELEVAEGEEQGYVFFDYPNRDKNDGSVAPNSKAWQIFEATLDRRLSLGEDLDTDELVGKRFAAEVVITKTGKRNRLQHDTIGPVSKKEKRQPEQKRPKLEVGLGKIPL
jgi:hypothetical protein